MEKIVVLLSFACLLVSGCGSSTTSSVGGLAANRITIAQSLAGCDTRQSPCSPTACEIQPGLRTNCQLKLGSEQVQAICTGSSVPYSCTPCPSGDSNNSIAGAWGNNCYYYCPAGTQWIQPNPNSPGQCTVVLVSGGTPCATDNDCAATGTCQNGNCVNSPALPTWYCNAPGQCGDPSYSCDTDTNTCRVNLGYNCIMGNHECAKGLTCCNTGSSTTCTNNLNNCFDPQDADPRWL